MFGRPSRPELVRVRPVRSENEERLRDAALAQHFTASLIQKMALERSNTKSVRAARQWLASRVKTMNRDTLRDVLTGRTVMTMVQLVDFEQALGEPVYSQIPRTRQ